MDHRAEERGRTQGGAGMSGRALQPQHARVLHHAASTAQNLPGERDQCNILVLLDSSFILLFPNSPPWDSLEIFLITGQQGK